MATDKELASRARRWTYRDIREVWGKLKSGDVTEDWPNGTAFEYMVIRAFEIEGARVKWPFQVRYRWVGRGPMEQIDGVVYAEGQGFLVESKNLTESVAIEAIAKLRFRLEARPPGMMAVLFSTSKFTQPAEVFAQFASPLNVLLWGQEALDVALKSETMLNSLKEKYRYAMEHGDPLLALGGK